MTGNNSTPKWIAIIVSVLILFFSVAYGAINVRVNRNNELIMEIRENITEMKSDIRYIKNNID